MQVDIDIEKIVSRSIIDGILHSSNVQKEVDHIIQSEEYQKILSGHIKTRLNELIFSEGGKKQIDDSIVNGIAKSYKVQNEIEEILENSEFRKILEKQAKTCLNEFISSEEGRSQIFSKVKEFLEGYDVECDEHFNNELSKWISDVLLMMMNESFQRIKTLNEQYTDSVKLGQE